MTTDETLELIQSTSAEAVLAHFAALPEPGRKRDAAAIAKLFKAKQRAGGLWNTDAKGDPAIMDIDSLRVAMFATSNASALLRAGAEMLPRNIDLAVVMGALKPAWLQQWVEGLIELRPNFVSYVAPLWEAGLCARPTSDAYILGYYATYSPLSQDDPVFVSTDLWRFFEVEGGGEFSLASHDKYCRAEDQWAQRIAALAEAGKVDRARLLDASLEALERDFAQFRAGWYSRFHQLLEPGLEELEARKERYLGLLSSSIPPTVSFALKQVQALDKAGRIDAADLIAALDGPLQARQKAAQTAALRMLKAAGKRAPDLREAAAVAATGALISEIAEVQEKALDVIEALGGAEAPAVREALSGYADHIAPSLRNRLSDLGAPAMPAAAPAGDEPLTGASAEPIQPISRADDALLAFLAVLEDPRDAMAVERAVDGIVRHGADLAGDALSPLRKRSRQLLDAPGEMLIRFLLAEFGYAISGADTADVSLAEIDALPRKPYIPEVSLAHVFRARSRELARQVASGKALPMLSAPTRSDGTVAASALVERLKDYAAAGAAPGPTDLNLALLRLWANIAAQEVPRDLPGPEIARAIGYALGGDEKPGRDPALWASAWAARPTPMDDTRISTLVGHALPEAGSPASYAITVRRIERDIYQYCQVAIDTEPPCRNAPTSLIAAQFFPEPDPPFWSASPCGHSSADVAWAALARPLSPESFFRHGFLALDPDQKLSDHFCRAYLGPLLRPGGPVGPVGRAMLAYYLASTDKSLTALTIDAIGQLVTDSRLEAAPFAKAIAPLLKTDALPIRRWTQAFAALAELSPRHATFVRSLVAELIDFPPEAAPRDMGGMLEMLFELHVAADAPLGHSRARACLAAVEGGGKLGRFARKLVALEG